jgi:hypothetical protein
VAPSSAHSQGSSHPRQQTPPALQLFIVTMYL